MKRQKSGRTTAETTLARFNAVPWSSRGRTTPLSRTAESVLPLGNFPARLPSIEQKRIVKHGDADFEASLMDIVGTGFQVGRGKILTCKHVCDGLRLKEKCAYVQATTKTPYGVYKGHWPISERIDFIDPRNEIELVDVDAALLISPAISTSDDPYEVPIVRWTDSANLGVGDRVVIGGYPLGTGLFLASSTNRGFVQPTFYDGIVSAIHPAARRGETRLIQISTVALGGISGGVVCDPRTGGVLGMVTSGLTDGEHSLPITYALPSEILFPFVESISFETASGQFWR